MPLTSLPVVAIGRVVSSAQTAIVVGHSTQIVIDFQVFGIVDDLLSHVEFSKRKMYQSVQLVPPEARIRESLQVDDEHLGK